MSDISITKIGIEISELKLIIAFMQKKGFQNNLEASFYLTNKEKPTSQLDTLRKCIVYWPSLLVK